MTEISIPSNIRNEELIKFVKEAVELCKPANVVWCDGSQAEYDRLCQ